MGTEWNCNLLPDRSSDTLQVDVPREQGRQDWRRGGDGKGLIWSFTNRRRVTREVGEVLWRRDLISTEEGVSGGN